MRIRTIPAMFPFFRHTPSISFTIRSHRSSELLSIVGALLLDRSLNHNHMLGEIKIALCIRNQNIGVQRGNQFNNNNNCVIIVWLVGV